MTYLQKYTARWDGNWSFWRAFVANYFGFSDTFPKTDALRREAERKLGSKLVGIIGPDRHDLRIIPLGFLDSVVLPVDYPLAELREEERQQKVAGEYVAGDRVAPIPVTLTTSGPLTITIGRKDMPTLAAARDAGLDEIAIYLRWRKP